MQKSKQETTIIKCIAKGCKEKVLIKLKTVDSKDTAELFFNFCYHHKKQVKAKIKEITNSTGKKEIEKIIQQDIVKNIINK